MWGQRDGRAFSARNSRTKRADWNGIDRSKEIVSLQIETLRVVDHGIRKTRADKDSPRYLPSIYKVIWAVAAQGRLHRNFPYVTCIERMPRIVVRSSVGA